MGRGGAVEESMEPGSSLRPPLSHVIIDLSRNCGSFRRPKSKIRVRCAALILFFFSPFEKKDAALGCSPSARTNAHTPTLPWEGEREYGCLS